MNVNIRKLHADAVIPAYATDGSAGFDMVAVEDVIIAPGETFRVCNYQGDEQQNS
jgi:dUTP pyrophosphatase